jgi:hypothetical protein
MMEHTKKYEYIDLRKFTKAEETQIDNIMSLVCPSCHSYSINKIKDDTTTINISFFYKGSLACQIKYNIIENSYRIKAYIDHLVQLVYLKKLNNHNIVRAQLKILNEML